MFKWLHRYFTTRQHFVGSVKAEITLHAEEYPRGRFKLYYKEPGDIRLSVDKYDKEVEPTVQSYDSCEILRRVRWRRVTIEAFDGYCYAPSLKELENALSHVTFFAWYRGNR